MMDIIMSYLEPAFYICVFGLIMCFIPINEDDIRRFRENSQIYMNRPVFNNHFSTSIHHDQFLDHIQIPSIDPSILNSSFSFYDPTSSVSSDRFTNVRPEAICRKKCPTCREISSNCTTIFSETKCVICFENVSKVTIYLKYD